MDDDRGVMGALARGLELMELQLCSNCRDFIIIQNVQLLKPFSVTNSIMRFLSRFLSLPVSFLKQAGIQFVVSRAQHTPPPSSEDSERCFGSTLLVNNYNQKPVLTLFKIGLERALCLDGRSRFCFLFYVLPHSKSMLERTACNNENAMPCCGSCVRGIV